MLLTPLSILISALAIVVAAAFLPSRVTMLSGLFGGKRPNLSEITRTIFDFDVATLTGETISLSKYRGKKAYLVVNVASQ